MRNWRTFTFQEWKDIYRTAIPDGGYDDAPAWWRGCIAAMRAVIKANSIHEAETVLKKDGWGRDVEDRLDAVKALWKAVGRRKRAARKNARR